MPRRSQNRAANAIQRRKENIFHIPEELDELYRNLGSTYLTVQAGALLMSMVRDRTWDFFLFDELAAFVICVLIWREAHRWIDLVKMMMWQSKPNATKKNPSDMSNSEQQSRPSETDSDIEIIEEECNADCCTNFRQEIVEEDTSTDGFVVYTGVEEDTTAEGNPTPEADDCTSENCGAKSQSTQFLANGRDDKRMLKKHQKRRDKRKLKKITKDGIITPSNFTHLKLVDWHPEKGFIVESVDKELEDFFILAGISEKNFKDDDTRNFIYDFIANHGGIERAKQEAEELKRLIVNTELEGDTTAEENTTSEADDCTSKGDDEEFVSRIILFYKNIVLGLAKALKNILP